MIRALPKMLKQWLHPTNRRVRLLVGLFLAGLFCIQCTRSEAFKPSDSPVVISAETFGQYDTEMLAKIERLAREDHIELLELCLANYQSNYQDFTCTFLKQERLHGRLGAEQEIQVKHMRSPFSVAMTWIRNAPIGDKVLYVEGQYNNQMLVRPKGKLLRGLVGGSVRRQPDGPEAMKNTLRPVSYFGFERGLERLLEVYRKADAAGDLQTAFGQYAEVAGRECVKLTRILPPKDDYPSYKTHTYIDLEYLLPLCIEGYDWDENLQCRYTYKDLKFNLGLTEDDFTPQANGIKTPD